MNDEIRCAIELSGATMRRGKRPGRLVGRIVTVRRAGDRPKRSCLSAGR